MWCLANTEDILYQHLNKFLQEMDTIEKDATDMSAILDPRSQRPSIQIHRERSPRSTLQMQKINEMEGFDDLLNQVLDKLTAEPKSSCRIISIVGMGGIGKTTLATNAYEHYSIIAYFDVRAWVTISQTYNMREILIKILSQFSTEKGRGGKSVEELSDLELQKTMYQTFFNRRYLLVLDDIWTIEAWEQLQHSFPKQDNGSRIMITTRLSYMARQLGCQHILDLHFLDEEKGWNLLRKIVFQGKSCPTALVKIGKGIAKKCKGLPLSLVVIGGLLANSEQTQKFWSSVTENLESLLNLEDEERCLKILHKSYIHLPIHLKPCFLYVGVFREDCLIRTSMLIKQLGAEGFLKPISGKSMEEVAKQYLQELIGRNLISVKSFGCNGNIKVCYIHDAIRLLCLREAKRETFLCMALERNVEVEQSLNASRIVVVHQSVLEKESLHQVLNSLQSTSTIRSFLCDGKGERPHQLHFKLLRICNMILDRDHSWGFSSACYSYERFRSIVNLRFLALNSISWHNDLAVYWNLQTLIVEERSLFFEKKVCVPIWHMHRIRHIKVPHLKLPNPTTMQMDNQDNECVLWNLQTLCILEDFRFCNETVKRIPNLKKLKICVGSLSREYNLNILACFQKLESLGLDFNWLQSKNVFRDSIHLPCSLKKLHLRSVELEWEDLMQNIGSLPFLQVLKLEILSGEGQEWNIDGGEFPNLKSLQIRDYKLKRWTAESTHFPCLEQLILEGLHQLEEIPSGIGDINTQLY